MGQVLGAATYCHSKGIAHRDIKPENIMLISDCPWNPFEVVDCKLIDFGLSGQLQDCKVVGTPAYMAPEIAEAWIARSEVGYRGEKADVWSIGLTTFQLMTGQLPFGEPKDHGDTIQPVFESITAYSSLEWDPDLWRGRSHDAFEFVQLLMTRDPNHRPEAIEAHEHDWIMNHRSHECPTLSRKILRSLQGYANAPMIEKVCLLLIATRLDDAHLTSIRHLFDGLDKRGTGTLHEEDFQEAIDESLHCCDAPIDISEIFDAEDLNGDGEIEYSEFVAGCLYSDLHSKGGCDLAMHAFDALDEDGDGVVTREEVLMFFNSQNPRHHEIIKSLPQKAFDQYEFYQFLKAESQNIDGQTSIRNPRKNRVIKQRSGFTTSVMDSFSSLLSCFCTTSHANDSNEEIFDDNSSSWSQPVLPSF
jgi:calcium-dependent protein kinase